MPQVHRATENHPVEETTASASAPSLLLRIFWMLAGYMILAICAVYIAMSEGAGAFSFIDPVFWAVAGLMVAARYVDIVRYNGTTSDGQPATLGHWRRYAAVVVAVAAVSWLVAHAVGYYA